MSSQFGSWSPDGFPNFQRVIVRVKIHWIKEFLKPSKSSQNIPKMGLHDPFGYLKHKLWPKERLGVNLTLEH